MAQLARGRRLPAGLAVVALVFGYWDLARGGITIAPLLLVLAYCALIPIAILRTAMPTADDTGSGGTGAGWGALVAGVALFSLYLATLSPSTAMWDASEYITAAYTLGLPHPPGNPLFVLIGRVMAVLPVAPNVAMRINVLAALASAVAAAMWFLVAHRVAARWLSGRWQPLLAGALAALIGGTAFTVWNQSVVNEKVYTLSLSGIALVSWLMVRWTETTDRKRADALLVLVAYLLGLGYANHMAGMLPLPAVGLSVLLTRPSTLLRWRLVLTCMAAITIGMTPFATQPIRSAFNPPLNEGEPTACREGLEFSCTFSRGTWKAFTYNLNREQYGKPELTERQAPFTAQVGMWWLYFRWQWLRDVHHERQPAQSAMASLFLVLGLLGAWVHYRRDRQSFTYFGPLMGLMTLGLIYYLNFQYGASQRPDLDVAREVRDRDYFFLWSFSAWGVWVSTGLLYLVNAISPLASRAGRGSQRERLRWLASVPLLGLAVVPLIANSDSAPRHDDVTTIAFARDLLNSVEPYGVLITGGDNDTFPLWYAQEVEGIRKDVTIAVLSLMNTDWFARGIIRRPVYEYDAMRGPSIYRNRSWPKPDGPPLRLTLAEADSVPPYFIVTEPLRFRQNGVDAVIDPRNLIQVQGGGLLERSDLLVLRMIADSWPQRPIYISRTTGNYAARLGLQDHVVSQGLARKLSPARDPVLPHLIFVAGSGWLDIERSRALWMEDMVGPDALLKLGNWVDRPSLSTPFSYLLAGSELAEALRLRGELAASAEIMDTVTRLAKAVRVEQLLPSAPLPVAGGDTASR